MQESQFDANRFDNKSIVLLIKQKATKNGRFDTFSGKSEVSFDIRKKGILGRLSRAA
jgi:hypothetical protein